jgi:PKD repeat protein
VEQEEPIFCLIAGDLSNRAEKAELQHAKIYLDELLVPWVPIMGNHDTWPEAAGECIKDDSYFQDIFSYKFDEASYIFPDWEKQEWQQFQDGGGSVGLQNWSFNIGPNHHLGLDLCKRSCGGNTGALGTIWNVTGGTYPWYNDHVANLPDKHERLVVLSHHPLDFGLTPGCRKQFGCEEARKLVNVIADNETEIAYWFGGHEQPFRSDWYWPCNLTWGNDAYDDYWDVGPTTGDKRIEAHYVTPTGRGLDYEPEDPENYHPWWYSVALVQVYSDFVCDFTISPNPAQKRQTVTFTSTSNHYGGSISEYAWNFGDGSSNFYVLTDEVSHTYNKPGVYWIKHRVKSGNQYAYMIRLLKVAGCPNNPHLEVEIREEWPGPNGFMSYLGPPVKYKADLEWWFDTTGSGAEFHRYFGGREYPYKDHFITNSVYGSGTFSHRAQPDPLDLQKHQTYKWSVYAEVTCEGESTPRSLGSNLVTKTPGGDTSSGGCPEVSVYHEDCPFAGDTVPFFLENNTILPHSEHYVEIRTDLMKLNGLKTDADHYYLNIRENDDETSYIDAGKLWVVDHPEGTEVATSSDDSIYVYSDVAFPFSCQDNEGEDCYDEIAYQDDEAYLGNSSSYLTVTFPNNGWSRKGVLLGMGIPVEGAEIAPMPKNYLGIPNKPDGQGGWIPLGEAFARKRPSMWLFDVSDVEDNTFRIDCSGDLCYINYVGLVKLEPEGWTKTEAPLDSAILWIVDPPGTAPVGSNVEDLISDPQTAGIISPYGQLALSFTEVPPDTTRQRDFVLQTSGYYIPGIGGGDGGEQSTTPSLRFDLEVQTLHGLRKAMLINYEVPVATDVKIAIVDVAGRVVAEPLKEEVAPGRHQLEWNWRDDAGRKVASGVYFVKMVAGEFTEVNKVVLIK